MDEFIGLLGGVPPTIAIGLAVWWFNREIEKMQAALKQQENALTAFKEAVAKDYAKADVHDEVLSIRADMNANFQTISSQIANLSNTVIAAVSRK